MGVAKVTFIPHEGNNHWPLALRHRSLAYVSSFLIATKIVAISALALTPHAAQLSTITENSMINFTNNARTEAGLPPLTVNDKLTQAARLKGEDMLKYQYFAHISPSGITPWFWMKKTGYSYQVAGENLAIDFLDGEDIVTAWLNSPTHKANLLHSEYTQTGIAVVSGEFQGGTSIIVVHMFGKPPQTPTTDEQAQETTEPTPQSIEKETPPATQPETVPLERPKVPRIALAHQPVNEQDSVSFQIEGEKHHAVVLLINNQERSITTLPESGSKTISVPVRSLKKGKLIARAFTRSVAGIESDISKPVSFVNPEPAPKEYSLALSPAFDKAQIAVVGASSSQPWQLFALDSSLAIDANVVRAVPQFAIGENAGEASFAATIVHVTRQFTSLILVVVSCLLLLTLLIRIRIQHPALIMHASLVIFLGVILLIA